MPASLAGQVLIYPELSGTTTYPSAVEFDGLVISRRHRGEVLGGLQRRTRPRPRPVCRSVDAEELGGLPPALVVLGGCDMFRDEGRTYAARLRDAGVDVDEVCYSGQPHGFVNFDFPAASLAFERIGTWLRETFTR